MYRSAVVTRRVADFTKRRSVSFLTAAIAALVAASAPQAGTRSVTVADPQDSGAYAFLGDVRELTATYDDAGSFSLNIKLYEPVGPAATIFPDAVVSGTAPCGLRLWATILPFSLFGTRFDVSTFQLCNGPTFGGLTFAGSMTRNGDSDFTFSGTHLSLRDQDYREGVFRLLTGTTKQCNIFGFCVERPGVTYDEVGFAFPAPPPPPATAPPPPAQPPPTATNKAPRLSAPKFTMAGHGPFGPRYYVTVSARFRVCDDSRGAMVAFVTESKKIGSDVVARRAFSRRLSSSASLCVSRRLTWRLADRFFGIGWYVVNVRVRDAGRALSKPVGKSWFTSD